MSEAHEKKYRIEVARLAEKALLKLPAQVRGAMVKRIDALASNPRPQGCKKLKGTEDLYRIRVGNYRVIYQIHDQQLLVLVVRVGNRKDIYWDT